MIHLKRARRVFAAWQRTQTEHSYVDHAAANVILDEDGNGIYAFWYCFFSTSEKPLGPWEFLQFWEALGGFEKDQYRRYAIRNLTCGKECGYGVKHYRFYFY